MWVIHLSNVETQYNYYTPTCELLVLVIRVCVLLSSLLLHREIPYLFATPPTPLNGIWCHFHRLFTKYWRSTPFITNIYQINWLGLRLSGGYFHIVTQTSSLLAYGSYLFSAHPTPLKEFNETFTYYLLNVLGVHFHCRLLSDCLFYTPI